MPSVRESEPTVYVPSLRIPACEIVDGVKKKTVPKVTGSPSSNVTLPERRTLSEHPTMNTKPSKTKGMNNFFVISFEVVSRPACETRIVCPPSSRLREKNRGGLLSALRQGDGISVVYRHQWTQNRVRPGCRGNPAHGTVPEEKLANTGMRTAKPLLRVVALTKTAREFIHP